MSSERGTLFTTQEFNRRAVGRRFSLVCRACFRELVRFLHPTELEKENEAGMPGRAGCKCVNQLNGPALRDNFRQVRESVKCFSDGPIGLNQ
jgi:hypothetical protein